MLCWQSGYRQLSPALTPESPSAQRGALERGWDRAGLWHQEQRREEPGNPELRLTLHRQLLPLRQDEAQTAVFKDTLPASSLGFSAPLAAPR